MRKFRMIMRIGTETHFSHFQSYEYSPVFGMSSPFFGMNLQTGDGPLKLFFFSCFMHSIHLESPSKHKSKI
ncbi:hypothetical protein PVL29_026186 [Vitis rotundifolia]|uniref:Uncharacterized protein n=1 Tax=Vitis rotundifolia TaxID=103349 RepID=A0AA38YM09_VITRO|nr:hypothetical protein PVL29_026186 [Vitis rotundifolia]